MLWIQYLSPFHQRYRMVTRSGAEEVGDVFHAIDLYKIWFASIISIKQIYAFMGYDKLKELSTYAL